MLRDCFIHEKGVDDPESAELLLVDGCGFRGESPPRVLLWWARCSLIFL